MSIDLSRFDNSNYHAGASLLKRGMWLFVNAVIFDSWLVPTSRIKRIILRLFGAKIGTGVIIKPRVNIKYPWHLTIGDHSWIGEGAWIDNLTRVSIGSNVCISQDAYLLTGNHDYKDPAFGLIVQEIHIEDGAWVGACAVVCPGVRVGRNAVLTVGSVLTKDAIANGIYRGNPSVQVRERTLTK